MDIKSFIIGKQSGGSSPSPGPSPTPEPVIPEDTPYEWVRPSNYPDLDSLTIDRTKTDFYITIDKNQSTTHTWNLTLYICNGNFTFGHIDNGVYVPDTDNLFTTNSVSINLDDYEGDILLGHYYNEGSGNISRFGTDTIAEFRGNVMNTVTTSNLFGPHVRRVDYSGKMQINAYWFSYLYDVNTIKLSNLIDSHLNRWEFSNDSKLYKIIGLENIDTSACTDMHNMFNSCYSLRDLDLSSFDTSNVTRMDSMFQNCSALKSINLSSFDTSKVTNMQQMFQDCSSLTNLDLSKFDTSNVTTMRNLFNYCHSLTELDLSSFDTSNVTTMEYMFNFCYNLKSINLSSFDTSNVTNMGYMFQNCFSLVELKLDNFILAPSVDLSCFTGSDFSLRSLDVSNMEITSTHSSLSNVIGSDYLKHINFFKSVDLSKVSTCCRFMMQSKMLQRESYLNIANKLPDNSENSAITISLQHKVAKKLSEEDIAILTNKNYTIAYYG